MAAPATVDEPGTFGLLAAILTGLPRLDGALCATKRGHFHEAETGNRIRIAECEATCRRCPVRAVCAEQAMTERAPVGVWAGKLHAIVHADDGETTKAQVRHGND